MNVNSIFTAGDNWVIQTDHGKCWHADWSLMELVPSSKGIWRVEYWESDNSPVIIDFPDIESVYLDLEKSLVEAQEFSAISKLGWEKWFGEAIELMHNPWPVLPFYTDLIPNTLENVRVRQLLSGSLKAWVFGKLGSWNDMYITDSSQEREYQRISKNLYWAVIQAYGAVANSTADEHYNELSKHLR